MIPPPNPYKIQPLSEYELIIVESLFPDNGTIFAELPIDETAFFAKGERQKWTNPPLWLRFLTIRGFYMPGELQSEVKQRTTLTMENALLILQAAERSGGIENLRQETAMEKDDLYPPDTWQIRMYMPTKDNPILAGQE